MKKKALFAATRSKVIACVLAATLAVSGLAIGLGGVFAAPTQTEYANPHAGKYVYATLDLSSPNTANRERTIGLSNVNRWENGDPAILSYTPMGNISITVKAEKPGYGVIVGASTTGMLTNYPFQVVDGGNIASYAYPNGQSMKVDKGAQNVEINVDTRTGLAPTTEKSGNSKISWISTDESILTISGSKINAKTTDGLAMIIGSFTDKWGTPQTLALMVQVGKSGESSTLYTYDNDKWMEIGNPHEGIYVKTNDKGEIVAPPEFLYAPNGDANGDGQLDEPVYRPVRFDNDGNVYAEVPPGSGQWHKIPFDPNNLGQPDFIEENGDYYKKDKNDPPYVWEVLDENGNAKEPAEYVGSTTDDGNGLPDTSKPLYKIQYGDNQTEPKAYRYAESQYAPWYLTMYPYPQGETTSEYERWQDAVNNIGGQAPTITGDGDKTVYNGHNGETISGIVITGSNPVTVTVTAGQNAVTWDNASKLLRVTDNLTNGNYTITLKASNGVSPDATYTFTLTVKDQPVGAGAKLGQTFVDKGVTWRVIAMDADGNKLITTDACWGSTSSYNGGIDAFARFENTKLNATTTRGHYYNWYNSKTSDALKAQALYPKLKGENGKDGIGYESTEITSANVYTIIEERALSEPAKGNDPHAEEPIFPLSVSEINKYRSNFKDGFAFAKQSGGDYNFYWLRSQGYKSNSSKGILCISDSGGFYFTRCGTSTNNRPAMWIKPE